MVGGSQETSQSHYTTELVQELYWGRTKERLRDRKNKQDREGERERENMKQ